MAEGAAPSLPKTKEEAGFRKQTRRNGTLMTIPRDGEGRRLELRPFIRKFELRIVQAREAGAMLRDALAG